MRRRAQHAVPVVEEHRVCDGSYTAMTRWARVGARPASRGAPAAAMLPAVATLLLAIAAATCGLWQLRDAVTFERRAIHVVGLRAATLRLQLDAESVVRAYAAKRRPELLRRYREGERALDSALDALRDATTDVDVAGGPALVETMRRLHARWTSAFALPLLGRPLSPRDAARAQRAGAPLLDAYRRVSDQLVFAIAGRIKRDIDSTNSQLLRITLLLASAVILCGISVGFAALRQMEVARTRLRTEALLREHAALLAQSRAQSRAFARAVLPPRLPAVPGCSFDAVYEAGANDARVGGDWYDAVRLLDGRILVSIGDVAGSGIEAAVVMGTARQIMRGIAQVHANPALMLDAADRALGLEHPDAFVTAWVGVVDLVTHTLTYASAGHPPPLVADTVGELRELSETSLPLGLRQGHQAAPSTLAIGDGATLVLYTDGLSEATRDVVAGSERIRQAVRTVAEAYGPHPAAAIARRVLAQRAADDVAILVVRVNFAEIEQHIARMSFDLSDAAAAHAARERFIAVLARRGFSELERFNAELVFGELIANVVRHAARSPQIEIAVDSSGPQIVLHVLDRGPGFRHSGRLPHDVYAESGRGLFLIAALTDDFSVTERPGSGSHARAVFISNSSRPIVREPAPAIELDAGALR